MQPDTRRLENKIAFVTGAGSGIGHATALHFASEGSAVVCHDLNPESASETAASIEETGGRALALVGDVTDSAGIEAAFAETAATLGPVDILVSNAGVAGLANDGSEGGTGIVGIDALTNEGFYRMLEIHLGGLLYTSRAAVRQMRAAGHGGSIIALSSIAGLVGMGPLHYATAKAGVLGFVKALAREVGSAQIRVNAICPGVIETPMLDVLPDGAIGPLKQMTPLGRLGQADDIARTAVYLASDDSAFVTAQALSPNGGLVVT